MPLGGKCKAMIIKLFLLIKLNIQDEIEDEISLDYNLVNMFHHNYNWILTYISKLVIDFKLKS
jgi:hypothetical protein